MIHPYISRDFSRKPRALSEFKQWKATELRQFLLHTGPVILKKVLPRFMYKHFFIFIYSNSNSFKLIADSVLH